MKIELECTKIERVLNGVYIVSFGGQSSVCLEMTLKNPTDYQVGKKYDLELTTIETGTSKDFKEMAREFFSCTREDKIKKLRDLLLDNFVDECGNLSLSGLDFSNFDGDVYISEMKVKKNLCQNSQEVGGNLFQGYQTVGGGITR